MPTFHEPLYTFIAEIFRKTSIFLFKYVSKDYIVLQLQGGEGRKGTVALPLPKIFQLCNFKSNNFSILNAELFFL